jgi:hypothetical protein
MAALFTHTLGLKVRNLPAQPHAATIIAPSPNAGHQPYTTRTAPLPAHLTPFQSAFPAALASSLARVTWGAKASWTQEFLNSR